MKTVLKIIPNIIWAVLLTLPAGAGGAEFSRGKIAGTHYTGATWAPSFWSNINIHDVDDDLGQIKSNGFNTIILVVPWVGFQPSVDPVRYHEEYFDILEHILVVSKRHDLQVIIRVGYAHEIGVESTPDHHARMVDLFSSPAVFAAWKDYLRRIHAIAGRFDHFLFGFITWEDFFLVGFTQAPAPVRLQFANKIGFTDYIKKYTLDQLSQWYATDFETHAQIPLPGYHSAAIFLFHEFWDHYLLELHRESQAVFPNLTMEIRVDCDPNPVRGGYLCHDKTFDLNGLSDTTLIYFSPAWGAANTGDADSADNAIKRLEYMLGMIRQGTDNHILIDQFNFVDNTPGFKRNTRIKADELADFIKKSYSVINKETLGYSLWTMTDLAGNCIGNGNFERGEMGWRIEKGEIFHDPGDKENRVRLSDGGSIAQELNLGGHVNPDAQNSGLRFTLKFKAGRESGPESRLAVELSDQQGERIFHRDARVSPGGGMNEIALTRLPLFVKGTLRITNAGSGIILDQVELYFRVQENGIYDVAGNPRPFRDAVVNLNRALVSSAADCLSYYRKADLYSKNINGVYPDGWVGRDVSGTVKVPQRKTDRMFLLEAYVPTHWKKYNNQVALFINDKKISTCELTTGYNRCEFKVHVDNNSAAYETVGFRIVPDHVYETKTFEIDSNDRRKLGFVLVGVGFNDQ